MIIKFDATCGYIGRIKCDSKLLPIWSRDFRQSVWFVKVKLWVIEWWNPLQDLRPTEALKKDLS